MTWYSQTDPRWANQRLGTVDGVTIGEAGCYVTALANLANDCGKSINPAQLDDIFTNNNLYIDGDMCFDGILTHVYSDIPFAWDHQFPGPADLSQLNNDPAVKQILEIDGWPAQPGLQTHFVYFWRYENGICWVIDSETGNLIDLQAVYGDLQTCIYGIITYTFNPPGPVPEQPAPPPVEPQPSASDPHDPVGAPVGEQPTDPQPVGPVPVPTPPESVPTPDPVPTPAPSEPTGLQALLAKLDAFRVTLQGYKTYISAGLLAAINVLTYVNAMHIPHLAILNNILGALTAIALAAKINRNK